jgi:hypothetical protein
MFWQGPEDPERACAERSRSVEGPGAGFTALSVLSVVEVAKRVPFGTVFYKGRLC